jgi:peptidoglycan/xylan/chitin deacetylase (PgdA/CDA1 family)
MSNNPKVFFSIDVEPDCMSFFKNCFRGMEEGLPALLDLLKEEDVKATFFSTGLVASKYPDVIKRLVSEDHELGCHGMNHQRFTALDRPSAKDEIQESSEILRKFAPVTSFRAPYLEFPDNYLDLLEDEDYLLDSSQAKYKIAYYKNREADTSLKRVPVSVTSSFLRLPLWFRTPFFRQLDDPVVLYVHPWEFVDLRQEKMRLDCRFKTGQTALDCVRSALRFFKKRNASFHKFADLTQTSQQN